MYVTMYVCLYVCMQCKSPGVRPIGVGEVLRRVIGKAVLEVTTDDIRRVVGTLQLCVGQISGCEAGIHAMKNYGQNPTQKPFYLQMRVMPSTPLVEKLP